MSERGHRLFLDYVANQLADPELAALNADEHAERLTRMAELAGIPLLEITEEVGHIGDALAVVLAQAASR